MTAAAETAGTTSRWRYLARLCAEARQAAGDQDAVRLYRVACRIERHALLALKDEATTERTSS